MKRKRKVISGLTTLVLLVVLLVFLLPIFWVALSSFKAPNDIFTLEFKFKFRPTFENYHAVLESAFPRKLLNSAVISLTAVILTLPSGLLAAYAFSRFRFRGKDSLFFLLLTTAMAPPVAFVVPIFMMFHQLRLLDTHIGLVLCYILSNIGFCTWVLRGFVEDVPREVEEAALVDGCTPWNVLFKITLPMISGGIVTTGILIFIFNWNEYLFASLLTRTQAATFTTHLVTYFGSRRVRWGELCAASTVGMLVPVVLALVARKYIVRGMTFGAVKG